MENPYEVLPTDTAADDQENPNRPTRSVEYQGTMIAIAGIGCVMGALQLLLMGAGFAIHGVFGVIAIFVGWLAMMYLCALLLRGTEQSIGERFAYCSILSIPAVVLYVPTCVAGGTMVFASRGSYAGAGTGLVFVAVSSLVFAGVAMLMALAARRHFRNLQPDATEKPAATPIEIP